MSKGIEYRLIRTAVNIKQFNGWRYNNEKIYNTLTWKEKEALHILIIEQFKFVLKQDRLKFKELVKLIKSNPKVIMLSDDVIKKMQMELLNKEVQRYRNERIK